MRRPGVESDRNVSRVRIKRSSKSRLRIDASLAAIAAPAQRVAMISHSTEIAEASAFDGRCDSAGAIGIAWEKVSH